jgi:hypothetical protein
MDPLYAMSYSIKDTKDFNQEKKYYIDNYLDNKLGYIDTNRVELGQFRSDGIIVDSNTEYRTNNFGFRDQNWRKASEIIAVGCSNTYGIGIPSEWTWPKILEKMTENTVNNLSKPGASINDLVLQLFAYFKKFGHPKIILCLFPDPFRIKIPVNKNLAVTKMQNENSPYGMLHSRADSINGYKNLPQYSKKPHYYENLIPMEVPLAFSMQSIHILEQYCNTNNIKLIWSSWYMDMQNVLTQIKDLPFNNFYSNNEFMVDNKIKMNTECHKNYADLPWEYFDGGLDIEDDASQAHPGIHRHIHIAEAFYEEIKNYNFRN